ncbi:MAG TPA: DNRLRE domain-containing protein [Candidatus Aminicenantes bacterium]|nr:DNRLRE domain-containing protein [Candidatus Aminicenantes bacterium]HRY64906.1 DNRLRE domain-containing protein [Candidatus Aminicenantes bacterium]HRZ71819.1 DNRLRE domain-containing protein [Candidatus Aminicenantes bacterium]
MHKGFKRVLKLVAFPFAAACLLTLTAAPVAAQVTIPQGSIVNSAEFAIFVQHHTTTETVTLYRITQGWDELGVNWQNFGSAWDGVVGSFVNDVYGWRTVDLTALVQAWVNGTYPNYGFLMMQNATSPYTAYYSSEYATIAQRPRLTITYTTPAGAVQTVVIQRPGAEQGGVADTIISEQLPTYYTWGNHPSLDTGLINGYVKISLLRFDFSVIPNSSPGTGTPGYWMNHPEAWPVSSIMIGGRTYTMEEAIALMKAPVGGDKTYTMFAALVAAKLNVMIGNDAGCVSAAITAADAWMATYYVGSGVAAGGPLSPWRVGEPLCSVLDNYNNGLLCAPHRD